MAIRYELPTELPRNEVEEAELLQVGQAIHRHYVALCLAKVAQTVHAFLDRHTDIVELQVEVARDGEWTVQYREMEDHNELSEPLTPEEWAPHTAMRKDFEQLNADLENSYDSEAFDAIADRYGRTEDNVENGVWLNLSDARIMLDESLATLRDLKPVVKPEPTPPVVAPSRRRSGLRR